MRNQLCWTLAALLLLESTVLEASLAAQLRPLDPLPLEVWQRSWSAELGGAVYQGQRASLAGEEGRLLEAGEFRLLARSGRVVMEASGTLRRSLRVQDRFAAPYGGAREEAERLGDAGDYRVSTTVQLSPGSSPGRLFLRFGSRLPTTDNQVGLERDRTDFFALLGGGGRWRGLQGGAEVGVGINGTREADYEQSDVLAYAFFLERAEGSLRPALRLAGHMDGRVGWATRGNEELAEVGFGLRAGRDDLFLRAEWVRGLAPFSPRSGVRILLGAGR